MNEINLDVKDRKLLFELDMNARASLTELSKKIGLSKQSIDYRIKKLVKEGVINGFYTIINTPKLGYMYTRFLIEFKDTAPEKEEEIIKYALSRKDFGWILTTEGRWNFTAVNWARDVSEIKNSVNEFIFRYGHYVKDYEITIATAIYHFQHKYLLNKKEGKVAMLTGKLEKPDIDKIDLGILQILDKKARASLSEIGNKLKISYKVVSYRIKNLERKGIIQGYRASINHQALGLTHYKVFLTMQNLTQKRLNGFKAFLQQHPSVIYITESIGFADIEFEALMKSHSDFYGLMKELRFNFSDIIKDYETLILHKFYKISYLPEELVK